MTRTTNWRTTWRVFRAEMGKIWRPLPLLGTLAVLIVGSFFIVNFTYLHNGGEDVVAQSAEFGPVYDAKAQQTVQAELDKARAAFAADMAVSTRATELGITDYAAYEAWTDRMYSEGKDTDPTVTNYVLGLASYRRINGLELIQSQAGISPDALRSQLLGQACYDFRNADDYPCGTLPATVTARIDDIISHYNQRSILQYNVVMTLQDSGKWMLLTAALCAMILTAFPLTRDRQLRMTAVQWASRTGRGIRSTQVLAIGISAALVGLIVGTLWNVWLGAQMRPILGYGIDSAMYRDPAWFDGTILQWLVAYTLTAMLAAAACSLITVWIVKAQSNGIRMLLITVPLAAAMACLINFVIGPYLYHFSNPLGGRIPVPGAEAMALTAMLALAAALWTVSARRIRHCELPND
ncbi:hypothetical protein [Bifidobacterium vespertilionis]|uniref:ABC transporter permease n=1 Tax=Bifidobacterium vespertilionis TaxID=2562524 RepID=A0A5J5E5N5_9BIFI|nr:hypothetical protein [Bifidobacterium vespertilionis]KAA8822440.1 hypothetical protein EMO90_00100 [Bifidobacterium vespertilionis]KAA8824498.1 hypothetical protein EM848_01425 [Bifidobacterium vespertilionis]